MPEELQGRLEGALRTATTTTRSHFARALVLVRSGLVGRAAVERWFESGAPGDVGRYLADRGLVDDATLERELLCRATDLPMEPGELASAQKAAGAVYGPYVRLQKLGEGATGSAWKAWDTKNRRLVTLRTLRAEHARLAESARAALGLVLPNVLSVIDVGQRDAEWYVVSDHAPGVNLRGWAMQHDKKVGQIVSHVRTVARALHRAHERGYLHRALRPENVIVAALGDAEHAFVCDFGMRGDPALMAPEQLRGDAAVDRRTDVYQLGATLFSALAGHPPFSRPTPQGLSDAILNVPPPSLRAIRADIPDSLSQAVARCLEKDSAKRFASMRELDAALLRTSLDQATARGAAPVSRGDDLKMQVVPVPRHEDLVVVALSGSITTATLVSFQEQVRALRERGVKRMIVELENVRFISSGGFGYLITLSDELRGSGGRVALVSMRKHVQLVYESLGLDAFFVVVATREEALKRLAPDLTEAEMAPAPAAKMETGALEAEAGDLSRELDRAAAMPDRAAARAAARWLLWRIESLLRADERSARAVALRGRALLVLGDAGRAEIELRKAGEAGAAPAADVVRRRETIVEAWKGRAPDRAPIEEQLAREPHRGDLYHLRALCRRASGDLLGALQDLNRALDLSVGAGEVHVTCALVMRALGDRGQCQEHFDRALRITSPDWPLRPHVVAMAGAAG